MDGLIESGKKPARKNGTLADQVTQVMMREIKDNTFQVHARMSSEIDMAQRFSVIRTAIRDAISRLKTEGLVGKRRRSGTSVHEPSMATPLWMSLDTH